MCHRRLSNKAGFLAAQAQFRFVLGIGSVRVHRTAAFVVLAGIPVGTSVSGGAHLAFAAVVVVACATIRQIVLPDQADEEMARGQEPTLDPFHVKQEPHGVHLGRIARAAA